MPDPSENQPETANKCTATTQVADRLSSSGDKEVLADIIGGIASQNYLGVIFDPLAKTVIAQAYYADFSIAMSDTVTMARNSSESGLYSAIGMMVFSIKQTIELSEIMPPSMFPFETEIDKSQIN